MKKLHSILAMLMIIAFALNFTSCSSDDEEEDTDAPEADEVPSAQDDEDDSEK